MKFVVGLLIGALTGVLTAFTCSDVLDTGIPKGAFWQSLSERWHQSDTILEPESQDLVFEKAGIEKTSVEKTSAEKASVEPVDFDHAIIESQQSIALGHHSEQASDSEVEPMFEAEPIPVPVAVHSPDAFQVAWIPFSSQTSATGFAEKLSLQLHKDFEIIKRGAGHYDVGFRYLTENERDYVLTSIESITGFRVPDNS